VLSIETSRSRMELFGHFRRVGYPNEVGPGVYDIHSPRVPTTDEIVDLLHRAAQDTLISARKRAKSRAAKSASRLSIRRHADRRLG